MITQAKQLAVKHAPRGIRANAIAPGSIDFPGRIWSRPKEEQPELPRGVRASIDWGPLGTPKLRTPKEVAHVAVFLVSPRATWVAGACIGVDGAQHRGMRWSTTNTVEQGMAALRAGSEGSWLHRLANRELRQLISERFVLTIWTTKVI